MSSEKQPRPMIFGHARISTTTQDESLQLDALDAAGCDRLMIDRASGAAAERPALAEMLDRLRPDDTVMVWRLDRLGRILRHLIEVVADLERRGVTLVSLTERIDTSSPGGKLVFASGEYDVATIARILGVSRASVPGVVVLAAARGRRVSGLVRRALADHQGLAGQGLHGRPGPAQRGHAGGSHRRRPCGGRSLGSPRGHP